MEKNIELKHTEKIKLLNSNFDLNDRLKPTSIFELFQDVACVHGEEMGVGFEEMLEKKLFWVVSRVKYDVLVVCGIGGSYLGSNAAIDANIAPVTGLFLPARGL